MLWQKSNCSLQERSMIVDTKNRTYNIFFPDTFSGKSTNVLFFYHGIPSNDPSEDLYNWINIANNNNLILVYPKSSGAKDCKNLVFYGYTSEECYDKGQIWEIQHVLDGLMVPVTPPYEIGIKSTCEKSDDLEFFDSILTKVTEELQSFNQSLGKVFSGGQGVGGHFAQYLSQCRAIDSYFTHSGGMKIIDFLTMTFVKVYYPILPTKNVRGLIIHDINDNTTSTNTGFDNGKTLGNVLHSLGHDFEFVKIQRADPNQAHFYYPNFNDAILTFLEGGEHNFTSSPVFNGIETSFDELSFSFDLNTFINYAFPALFIVGLILVTIIIVILLMPLFVCVYCCCKGSKRGYDSDEELSDMDFD